MPLKLSGKVAVVTGASRGGKGDTFPSSTIWPS